MSEKRANTAMMASRPITLLLALTPILAGCSARNTGTPAAQQAPEAPESAATQVVVQRSPVPAFHGSGADWKLDLKADSGTRYTARLLRSGSWTNATLVLRSAAPAEHPNDFDFDGTLFATHGDTPLRVRIVHADCKDAGGVVRMQTVNIVVTGAATLSGCGEITPY